MFHVSIWDEALFKRDEFPTIERVSEVDCKDVGDVIKVLEATASHATNIAAESAYNGFANTVKYERLFFKFVGKRLKGTIEFTIV